jgi:broad specificity phosphatase PhoE
MSDRAGAGVAGLERHAATGGGLDGILLARHGETDDNIEPIRAQGFRDTPLNANGVRQAHELAGLIADRYRVRSLWSSDLQRAAATAAIVGERIGLEVHLEPRLREGSRGRWEGRLFVDIARDEPGLYAAWMRAGADFRFPGGESLQEHSDRVAAAIDDIRAADELPALLVCHRGSIRVMLCRSDPRGLDAFHDYNVPNIGVVPL